MSTAILYAFQKYLYKLKIFQNNKKKTRKHSINFRKLMAHDWQVDWLLNRVAIARWSTQRMSHMHVCVLTNRERTEWLFRSRAVTITRQGRRNQTEANQTSTRRDLTWLSLSSVIARSVISKVVREIRFSCDRWQNDLTYSNRLIISTGNSPISLNLKYSLHAILLYTY